jgi:putative peptidoglycan lipid II flippase
MARAALLVGAGILVSRLLGFVRNSVLLGVLGLSGEADLYNAAFVIPDYLFFLMAGGYLTITFLPILSRHIAAGDEEGEWRSFVAVFRPVALVMTGLTVLAMIWARPLVEFLYRSFDPSDLDRLTSLVRVVLPAQVFFVLGSLFMAVQYARQRFLVPTLAPIVYNLAIIAGGAITWAMGNPSPEGFAWGALAGAIVGNFALQWWGASQVGLRWPRQVSWRDPALGEYLLLALPLMLGQSVAALDEQFIRVFGQLAGVGGITALVAGRQLSMVPVGVVAQAAGVAAYPFLAKLAAEGREGELEAEVGSAVRGTITAAALAAAAVFGLALPAVRLAYQRGSFGAEDTLVTAAVAAVFALSIPAWGAQQILARAFYARRRMWTPVLIGTAVAIVAIAVYLIVGNSFGLEGIAAVSTGSIVVYAILLGVGWFIATGRRQLRPVLEALARALVGGVLAGAAGLGIVALLASGEAVPSAGVSLLALLLGGLLVVAVFAGCLAAMRSPELARLLRRHPSQGGEG